MTISADVKQYIYELRGTEWLDKFSRTYDASTAAEKKTGAEVVLYFGMTGILNLGMAIVVFVMVADTAQQTLPTADSTSGAGIAWIITALYHTLAWTTVIVMWILTMIEDFKFDNIIWFVDVVTIVKYCTAYGMYGVLFIILLVTTLNDADYKTYLAPPIIYLFLAGIDMFV